MTATILGTPHEFSEAAEAVRRKGGRVGLVPTMGALHEGHLSLIRRAKECSDEVFVTIFVNPTQFGPNEDFAAYPRNLVKDVELAASAGASSVFAPKAADMYPTTERTRVRVSGLTDGLCGASRPGHFEGVATIVTKIFALTGRSTAVFGRKDYQQLKVIEALARDLFLPVSILAHPTVREADGLALSSRNAYLSGEDRQRALSIPRALSAANGAFGSGERAPAVILETVRGALDRAGLRIDYVDLRDAESLAPLADSAALPERALLAVAAHAGKTRLIDNLVLGEEPSPIVGSAR